MNEDKKIQSIIKLWLRENGVNQSTLARAFNFCPGAISAALNPCNRVSDGMLFRLAHAIDGLQPYAQAIAEDRLKKARKWRTDNVVAKKAREDKARRVATRQKAIDRLKSHPPAYNFPRAVE